jgi:hypothetical protein
MPDDIDLLSLLDGARHNCPLGECVAAAVAYYAGQSKPQRPMSLGPTVSSCGFSGDVTFDVQLAAQPPAPARSEKVAVYWKAEGHPHCQPELKKMASELAQHLDAPMTIRLAAEAIALAAFLALYPDKGVTERSFPFSFDAENPLGLSFFYLYEDRSEALLVLPGGPVNAWNDACWRLQANPLIETGWVASVDLGANQITLTQVK